MNPVQRKARIAGLWYLAVTLTGIFTLMVAPSKFLVPGDAAATVQKILASESFFRTYMAVGLVSSLCFLMLALALHELFKDVDRSLSRLMVILVLIQVPNAWVGAVTEGMALELAKGSAFMGAFAPAQQQALAMLFLRLDHFGVVAAQLLWGLWLFPLAALTLRSGFLPRILGWWLHINGLAYVAVWGVGVFAPQHFGKVNDLLFPLLLGEVAFMLWLLIRGAKEPAEA
ncbi:MAG TPA: DUF4386 domain-containing protein [Holophagaceae bacterium]|nr:DUF4386 domain-containing protein [Holophagaceae bacterium]